MEKARNGNPRAVEELAAAGRALGIAMASLSQIFFPDCIALAGGLAEAEDLVLPARGSFFPQGRECGSAREQESGEGSLGWRATVIGAAVPLFDP